MNPLCLFVAGRRSLLVGGRLQDVSASERSSRVFSGLTSHSDEEEVLASRSPVGVLAYNEVNDPESDLFFDFIFVD